jgi:hypothetical protein
MGHFVPALNGPCSCPPMGRDLGPNPARYIGPCRPGTKIFRAVPGPCFFYRASGRPIRPGPNVHLYILLPLLSLSLSSLSPLSLACTGSRLPPGEPPHPSCLAVLPHAAKETRRPRHGPALCLSPTRDIKSARPARPCIDQPRQHRTRPGHEAAVPFRFPVNGLHASEILSSPPFLSIEAMRRNCHH